MTSPPLRLIPIVRVSKTGERLKLRSPKQQLRDIQRWAQDNGYELLPHVEEIDVSGRKGARSRPVLEAAKARVLTGEADGIVVAYVSRFTRNTLYGLTLVQEVLDAGRRFFALDMPQADLATPDGRRQLRDKLSDAEYESDVRRGHFLTGVRDAIEDGVHLNVPFGYRRSNGNASPLAIEKKEAALVKATYEWRAEGWSWQRIAVAANERGPMPRPRRWKRDAEPVQSRWTHKTTRGLLYGENSKPRRVYLGVALNGEHETPNAHPAIVDSALFERATRARGTRPVGPDDGYLLSGLVRCAGCGYVMTSGKHVSGTRYYRCRSAQSGAGDCPAPANANAETLETYAADQFGVWLDEYLSRLDFSVSDSAHREASGKVREVETRIRNLMRQMSRKTDITPDFQAFFDEEQESLTRELADARAEESRALSLSDGPDIPEGFELMAVPVPEQRLRLSEVFAFVIVRRAESYREPVVSRSRMVWSDGPPRDNAGRIAFAKSVRW